MENLEFRPADYRGIKEDVIDLIQFLRTTIYPEIFGDISDQYVLEESKERAHFHLRNVLRRLLKDDKTICQKSLDLMNSLPEIKRMLDTDVDAAYEGDPAAKSREEVMLSYPSFEAVSIYRIAHKLYELDVPILPRMMTEYAHRTTGIDIHPGAAIGEYFFIDHGTGVVIGETATIGHHVKLYQGVTIGAKSFEVSEDGSLVKGIKRHPDIGNHVVIYSGSTILGGQTKIGDHCTIGGNVWLTHSVASGETIIAAHEKSENISFQ